MSPNQHIVGDDKPELAHQTDNAGQTKRSWWSWRRSQDAAPNQASNMAINHKNTELGKDEKGRLKSSLYGIAIANLLVQLQMVIRLQSAHKHQDQIHRTSAIVR